MHAARLTAVVVLPTPPFWFAIASVLIDDNLAGHGVRTSGPKRRARRGAERGGAGEAAVNGVRPVGVCARFRAASGIRRVSGRPCGRCGGDGPHCQHMARCGPPRWGEAEQLRSARAGLRLEFRHLALPGDERAADPQERRGVLAEDGQRGQRARRHEVVTAGSGRPVLGPGADDMGIGHTGVRAETFEERAFPRDALDERPWRRGERRRGRSRESQRPPRGRRSSGRSTRSQG